MEAEPRGDAASDLRARRLQRARWHRRRRRLGFLVFLLVAAGVLALAYEAVSGDDDRAGVSATPTFATTTPPVPPAGPYKVTDGVNVRSGPGTTFPSVATIEIGKEVMVTCVTAGETVNGPRGSVSTWVHVTAPGVDGYVTSLYVATGAAIDDPNVIPRC